jgi:hypothetical protein
MRVVLVLGCRGRRHNGFRMCGGVENEILDLTGSSEMNSVVADHLDSVYHMFDRPLLNNVHTALYSLQEKLARDGRTVFKTDQYRLLEAFCVMHAKCGLLLRLKLEEIDGYK